MSQRRKKMFNQSGPLTTGKPNDHRWTPMPTQPEQSHSENLQTSANLKSNANWKPLQPKPQATYKRHHCCSRLPAQQPSLHLQITRSTTRQQNPACCIAPSANLKTKLEMHRGQQSQHNVKSSGTSHKTIWGGEQLEDGRINQPYHESCCQYGHNFQSGNFSQLHRILL